MTPQIATTKEQSERLIKSGVNPKSADMYLSVNLNKGENYGKFSTHVLGNETLTMDEIMKMRDYLPAWSLSALLALLPKDLTWQDMYYRLVMGPNERGWEIEYNDLSCTYNLHHAESETLIECAVKMFEWLTANNYKLNKI